MFATQSNLITASNFALPMDGMENSPLAHDALFTDTKDTDEPIYDLQQLRTLQHYFSCISADTSAFQMAILPFLNAHWAENADALIATIQSFAAKFNPADYRIAVETTKYYLNSRDFAAPNRFTKNSYLLGSFEWTSETPALQNLNQKLASLIAENTLQNQSDAEADNSWSTTFQWAWDQTKSGISNLASYTAEHPMLVGSMVLLGESLVVTAQIPTNGLVAYYPFSGNANDMSGNGNNGVVSGATLSTDRFGNANKAYYFNGAAYIKGSCATFPVRERSISLWFNAEKLFTSAACATVFAYGGNGCAPICTSYAMMVGDCNYGEVYDVQASFGYHQLNVPYNKTTIIGMWHHWLVTNDANGLKFYVDGVDIGSNSEFITETYVQNRDFAIGTYVNFNSGLAPYSDGCVTYFIGRLDDIRIYNRSLAQAEITALYNEANPVTSGIPTNGLVAYWPFNGNANDMSGNGNSGVVNGATLVTDRFGKVNSAYSFNGAGNYILIGSPVPASLQIQNAISLSAWIYATSYPTSAPDNMGAIVGCQSDIPGPYGITMFLDSRTNPDGSPSVPAGHIHVGTGGSGTWRPANSQTSVPLNQWVYIVAVRNATSFNVYYNAVAQAVTTSSNYGSSWSGAVSYSSGAYTIGYESGYSRYFNGKIDDIRVYNRVLTQTEVTALYNEGVVNSAPTLSAVTKNGLEGATLTFTAADFTGHFSDVDGNSLTKIKIISLPTSGTLQLSAVSVTLNQEIPVANLGSLTFVPTAHWTGATSFSWNGYDGTLYATNSATVNISIADNPPTLSTITKNGLEGAILTFNTTDFTGHFSDVDGDSLIKIKILSLPISGTLQLSGGSVTLNQEIPAANLGSLTFVPTAHWAGSTSFSWNGYDGALYATNSATVTISIADNPPTLSAVTKNGLEGATLTFTTTDFTGHFSDVDGDSLTKIKILSLPTSGTLQLSGGSVALNQEIPMANLGSLTFVPTAHWTGSTSFSWNGYDGALYATNSATVTISIADNPPTLSAITKNGLENATIAFTAADFTDHFSDIDGDSLTKIKIISLPTSGVLQLSQVAVNVNQEIPVANLGNLAFIPNANWTGSTSFDWNGYDGTLYASNPTTLTISISASTPSNTNTESSSNMAGIIGGTLGGIVAVLVGGAACFFGGKYYQHEKEQKQELKAKSLAEFQKDLCNNVYIQLSGSLQLDKKNWSELQDVIDQALLQAKTEVCQTLEQLSKIEQIKWQKSLALLLANEIKQLYHLQNLDVLVTRFKQVLLEEVNKAPTKLEPVPNQALEMSVLSPQQIDLPSIIVPMTLPQQQNVNVYSSTAQPNAPTLPSLQQSSKQTFFALPERANNTTLDGQAIYPDSNQQEIDEGVNKVPGT